VELSSRFSANGMGGLEILSEDGGLVVHRGWREGAGGEREDVLIVRPAAEQPAPATLDRLAHEYSFKDELDSTWAVRPLELVRDHGQTILVLEDTGGELLSAHVGSPMEVGRFLRIAIGVAAALAKVHQRGLIHKDFKPANILVNTASGEVLLTGFGTASRLTRERQPPDPPEVIAGTLAYMAPEQTGRMNRSIDSRSDLYSLGVTLYEVLTGSLPFTASDPMEWVHCHIARQPVAPSKRLTDVPVAISNIIMKLLAKAAEDRYQTAAGLESDLRHCLDDWEHQGRIGDFPPGQHDIPDLLLIPEKLYGRDSEVATLLAAFERIVQSGAPELVLVSGYSGVGKSSVVNELHKALVLPRGLFASGKFDQYKRDIPYATLAQAFQSLVRPLLIRSEAELRNWREAFQEALGPNALLIVDLVPELRFIVGEQPPVPVLPPQDAQRRFQLVFRRFIGVFARPEHPLALFFDDLQWLDPATLDLLEDLLTQQDVPYLMLIGAYRDNEVDSTHPLMRKLEMLRKTGAAVQEIVLAPLVRNDLEQLIGDFLRCEPERTAPLAELVHEKTNGNPFFSIQFVYSLAEEGLLIFDHRDSRWSWNLARIHTKGYTDNVVDLVVEKLSRLPIETRNALHQLACFGNSADFAMLTTVYELSADDMHSHLQEAVRAGLILIWEGTYRFLHDRVQEAAYSLIPDGERAAAHLRIGRLLLSYIRPEQREEAIFEIVNQLNRGSQLIRSTEERRHLAELNLIAGRRGKISTAYISALFYLGAARALLTEKSWDEDYDLMFAIECDTAECELLSANMVSAENRLLMLAQLAKGAHDLASVTRLRLTLYTTLERSDRAVEVCLEYLRRGGTEWSSHPTSDEVRHEYDRIWSQVGNRKIEELIDLPLMTNRGALETLHVLTEFVSPAHFYDDNLCSLVTCHMVNLSLEHGNSDGSCFAYQWFGFIAGPRFGDYAAGFQFGRLGYDLVEKRGLKRFRARTYMYFGNVIMPWTKHVQAGRDLIRRAFDAANEIGDLTFAAFGINHLITNLIAAGDQLAEVQREAENGLAFTQKVRFGLMIDNVTAQLAFIRTLRGLTAKFGYFDDGSFAEDQFERHLATNPGSAVVEFRYLVRKAQARFLAGDYATAVAAVLRARGLISKSPSFFETAEIHFYAALSHAACWDFAPPQPREQHFEALTTHHGQLQEWAQNCPENFQNRAALVGAEIARIEGRDLDAMRLYEQAIRSAREHGFVQNEGVAYEVAARFYSARGSETSAKAHLCEARDCYLRWGADGKVRQLDRLYPHLAAAEKQRPAATIGSAIQQLDVASVVKASQALSGEILLPKLIHRLMTIALENAGADRGLLILPSEHEYLIQAEARATGDQIEVTMREELLTGITCPESLVRYVIRTRESVILDDASKPNLFSADDYLCDQQSKSILCLPLIKQQQLAGILLLENALTSHAFTPARITILELLAAQAAISLENTRLYSDVREREAKVRRLVDSNIIGVLIIDLGGQLIEANDAFLGMVGYEREDLVSGRMRWTDLTPPEWRTGDAKRVEALESTGTLQPFEKEYFHKDGSRVPALVGVARFEETGNQAVAFVVDLTARKRAESELAHANRVATMGHLTASIAHEVNQPIAALLTNAETAMRWLARQPPNSERAKPLIDRIISDGKRAADIVSRIRDFSKKAPARKGNLEINEAILEIVKLTRAAMSDHSVLVKMQLSERLPPILGDRVQLQQVMLNLIMNAIEAMSEVREGSRELLISTSEVESGGVFVAVSDSGPGLPLTNFARIFEAFYTTKSSGLGMGLSICRSIVEAHGGRLWATRNEPHGAVFCMMLPVGEEALENAESSGV
jgi:PAS domain S-box-containing protein